MLNTFCVKNQKYMDLTLETADICLRNSYLLLSKLKQIDDKKKELLRKVILRMAYVALLLGNPVIALEHSKRVLTMPNCTQSAR